MKFNRVRPHTNKIIAILPDAVEDLLYSVKRTKVTDQGVVTPTTLTTNLSGSIGGVWPKW